MSNIPQSKADLTWQHHFVYYTFLPMVGILVLSIVSSPVLWYFNHIPFRIALAFPWGAMGIAMMYMSFFGDYVIPVETYKNVRSGKYEKYE